MPVTVVFASLDQIATAVAAKVVASLQPQFNELEKENQSMGLDITALQTAVANETTVEQSAITLLGGLTQQIQALINASGNTVDPAALQSLVDQMTASQSALAAAVTANTPAAK